MDNSKDFGQSSHNISVPGPSRIRKSASPPNKKYTKPNRGSESSEDESALFASDNKPINYKPDPDFVKKIFEQYGDGDKIFTPKNLFNKDGLLGINNPPITNYMDHFDRRKSKRRSLKRKRKESTSEEDDSYLGYVSPPRTPAPELSEERNYRQAIAAMEGRKDFCEILESCGIDSKEYIQKTFGFKTNTGSKNDCNTPRPYPTKAEDVPTPLRDGMRAYEFNFSTGPPTTSVIKIRTPDIKDYNIEIDDGMKEILVGFTFYVDVFTCGLNVSDSFKKVLLQLGGSVKNRFTKKVTHVIFKEGRNYIYKKARQAKIPVISIRWIEACKKARRAVDPTEYRPFGIEEYKYDSDSEHLIKVEKLNRCVRRMNRKYNKESGSSNTPDTSSRRKKSKKKAITELKKQAIRKNVLNSDRLCTKKLDSTNNASEGMDDNNDQLND